jgi:hypothetical protein
MQKHVAYAIVLITILITYVWYKHINTSPTSQESFSTMNVIPITIKYKTTLSLSTRSDPYEFFVRDMLLKHGEVFLHDDVKNTVKVFKCSSAFCDTPSSDVMLGVAPRGGGQLFTRDDLKAGRTYRVEGFINNVTYHSLPIEISAHSFIQRGKPLDVSIIEQIITNAHLHVMLKETPSISDIYNVQACNWDPIRKHSTCQRIEWNDKDESEYVFKPLNGHDSMLRITAKTTS